MRSLLSVLEIFFGILKLILAGILGWILIILSPILLMILGVWVVVENYQKNHEIDRLFCKKCDALMGRGSFELAKTENTKLWQEFNTKVAEMEQIRKATLADTNATPLERMLASSGTMPYYGSPRTVAAVCCICGAKYMYSKDRRFKMLVENQNL
jgi:hypothetical protein